MSPQSIFNYPGWISFFRAFFAESEPEVRLSENRLRGRSVRPGDAVAAFDIKESNSLDTNKLRGFRDIPTVRHSN